MQFYSSEKRWINNIFILIQKHRKVPICTWSHRKSNSTFFTLIGIKTEVIRSTCFVYSKNLCYYSIFRILCLSLNLNLFLYPKCRFDMSSSAFLTSCIYKISPKMMMMLWWGWNDGTSGSSRGEKRERIITKHTFSIIFIVSSCILKNRAGFWV